MTSRRQFILKGLGGAAAAIAVPILSTTPWRDGDGGSLVVGNTLHREGVYQNDEAKTAEDVPGQILRYTPKSGTLVAYDVPIFAHSLACHPMDSQVLLGVSKWTPSALVYDLRSSRVVANLECPEGIRFFGHGQFSARGDKAAISAYSHKVRHPYVCIYDCNDWKMTDMVSLGDGKGTQTPHDLVFLPSGDILATISNFGEKLPSYFVRLDSSSHQLKEKFEMPPGCAHLLLRSDGQLIVTGMSTTDTETTTQLFIFDLDNNRIKSIADSPDFSSLNLRAPALSVEEISDSHIVATLSEQNAILLWDHQTNRLRIIDGKGFALGAAKTPNGFYAVFESSLVKFKWQGELNLIKLGEKASFGNAAHMTYIPS